MLRGAVSSDVWVVLGDALVRGFVAATVLVLVGHGDGAHGGHGDQKGCSGDLHIEECEVE